MEWKKVCRQKKTLGIIVALFFIQLFFFLYLGQIGKLETESETKRQKYITEYRSQIEATIDQAESMGKFSIFVKEDSFSKDNLETTKKDFEGLLSVTPILFDSTFLIQFFSYALLDGAVVLCGIILTGVYIDKNKYGLKSMIFSSVNGRGKLIIKRISAIFLWDGILAFLFYGGTLLIGSVLYKANLWECLNYPIQSVSTFQNLTWRVSVGEFLMCYIAYKWLILFFISLVVWVIHLLVEHSMMVVGTVGVIGISSYLLYRFVDVNHTYNIFKYCNFWYPMLESKMFSEYKNLNIFSNAVNKMTVVFVFVVLGIVLFTGAALIIGVKKYPCTVHFSGIKSRFQKFGMKIKYLNGKILEKLSLTGFELYKILISQKGLIILVVLVFLLISNVDLKNVQWSVAQTMYYEFMDEHTGVPDKESQKQIQKWRNMLSYAENKYQEAQTLYANGMMSIDEWINRSMEYESYGEDRMFLAQMEDQTDYLERLEKKKDISGWYVNLYSYYHLLEAGGTLQNMIFIFAIVVLSSGMFFYEKDKGMLELMRTSTKGRAITFKRKLKTVVLITTLLYCIMVFLEVLEVAVVYGLNGLAAPVQSLPKLYFIEIPCSIGTFFVIFYLIKGMIIISVAVFISILSMKIGQKATVLIALGLCVPVLLYQIGFEIFKYFSISEILSVIPFLLQVKSVVAVLIVSLVIYVIAIASALWGYKKWCRV